MALSGKLLLIALLLGGVGLTLTLGTLDSLKIQAQAPPRAEFEVASIRPNQSEDVRVSGGFQPGGRFHATNYTLRSLIASAYLRPQVNPDFLITGGPKWIDVDRFDVDAKAAGEFPAAPDSPTAPRRRMLQALLADRFQLKVHIETEERPIYVLQMARGGRKTGAGLAPATGACAAAGNGAPTPGGNAGCGPRIGPGTVELGATTMAQFTSLLPRFVDRVVRDETGLSGSYALKLTWTPAPGEWIAPPAPGGKESPAADGPSLFTALQEQLGLKLEPGRGPVEVLGIDRVERLSEN